MTLNLPVPLRRVLLWVSTTAWLNLAKPRINNIISLAIVDWTQSEKNKEKQGECYFSITSERTEKKLERGESLKKEGLHIRVSEV